jgi:proteic killer suppression protein
LHGYRDSGIDKDVIVSFGDEATADLFHGKKSPKARRFPSDIQQRATRKLDILNAAADMQDLRAPPSKHLERLSGGLEGYWSVRVNDQWRIVFRWNDGSAMDVKLTDYH